MCGAEVPVTKPVFIEGTRLNVCPNCSKFGDENRGSSSAKSGPAPSAEIIEQRLQKRERRMQTKDVYSAAETTQIVDDYGTVIKNARVGKNIDLEQFAASIGEKKGILAKIEVNDLLPDDKLIKKIEKALDIKLTEVVASGSAIGGGAAGNKMTLANFVKKK